MKMLLLTNIGHRDLASLNAPALTQDDAREGHIVDIPDKKVVDALKARNWAREATAADEKAVAEAKEAQEAADAQRAAIAATAGRPVVVNPAAGAPRRTTPIT